MLCLAAIATAVALAYALILNKYAILYNIKF